MLLHRSTVWKRRHSSKTKPTIHKANIPRLSLLLESSSPQQNANAKFIIEETASPAGQGPSTRAPPAWSPITPPARTYTSTSTSVKAPSWSPITPQAPSSAPLPANLTAHWPPISSPPPSAAAPTLTEPATSSGTATNGTAAFQQLLVNVYGEAAFRLVSLGDWDKHMGVYNLPFEELPIRPALAESRQLPGLRALGLDGRYEIGQMGFFTWRSKLFGPP